MKLFHKIPLLSVCAVLLLLLLPGCWVLAQLHIFALGFSTLWLILSVPIMMCMAVWGEWNLSKIRRHLNHDLETGLGSRIWFEQRLAQECALAQRQSYAVSVMVLQVNADQTVEEARILSAVGEHLLHTVRQGESISRIADNRLALIAVHCGVQQAGLLQQRIQRHLENLRVQGKQGQLLSFHWSIHLLVPENNNVDSLYFQQQLRTL